jgi:hypothetical protein
MATPGSNPSNSNSADDEARVGRIEAEALSWKNILNLKRQLNKTAKEEQSLREQIVKLGREQARNAIEYKDTTDAIKQYEKDLKQAREQNNRQSIVFYTREIEAEKKKQEEQKKTAGGALMAMAIEAKEKKKSLTTEKQLIQDINKQRGIGAKFLDLFRSEKAVQRKIDLARAKAGGGLNPQESEAAAKRREAREAGGGGGSFAGKAALGALAVGAAALVSTVKLAGNAIKSAMVAPLNDAAKLMGGGYGMGGGAVTGEGATSILGGFSSLLKTIPFIGGLLGGLVDMFKSLVDAVLGVEAANVRVARTLGISKGAAAGLREQYRQIGMASGNIVVNETRMLESEIELNQQLGIQKGLTGDILANNVQLKELAGFELAERKAIAETSIVTMRSATGITKGVLAQVVGFKQLTGIAFNYKSIFGEAAKLGGVLGLQFAKYPEKLTRTLMVTKALGFDLKNLDSLASSFLDFESSISKEFEAQVITGKQLNLTKAREAAMNNNLVELAREITKEVGSTDEFLKMNRFEQEAIAEAVHMTRDGLADALKQQQIFTRLGATNIQQAAQRLELLRQQGKTETEINKMLGENAYNYITQTSTAERLVEMMNRLKTTFVNFIEKSGILDFITNPQKVQAFVTALIDRLAGAVTLIGDIMSGVLRAIGYLPFTDKGKWESMADRVQAGTGSLAGAFTATAASFGGGASVGETVANGKKSEAKAAQAATKTGVPFLNAQQSQDINVILNVDGQPLARQTIKAQSQSHTTTMA